MSRDAQLLRSVFDAAPDGVISLHAVRDEDGDVVSFTWGVMNRAAQDWFGRDQLDLTGRDALELDSAMADDGRLERFVRVLDTGSSVSFTRRMQHPIHGEPRTLRLRVSKLEEADGIVVTATDITATLADTEISGSRTMRDPLTGVATSWAVEQVLQTELARAERYRRPLTTIMIDVDHLARINEAHGREAGDRALQILTRVLTASLRTTDHVGRVGGEEFLVVLPETPLDGAFDLAERIRQRVSTIVVRLPGTTTRLTVSLGVAGLQSGEKRDSLLARAERALVAAKRGGRDRVELAPAA